MCSFLLASFIIANASINFNAKMQRRGPDLTSRLTIRGLEFVHNLLHLTGPATVQPLIEPDRGGAALFNGEVYNHAVLARELGLQSGLSDGQVTYEIMEA